MLTVGSSTFSGGSASTAVGAHRVSEMRGVSMPVSATMSPAEALARDSRVSPWKPRTSSTREFRVRPSVSMTVTFIAGVTVPRLMRPMQIAPT